ncbi:MAG: phosphotransferase family protein [Thermomicrobiales bacterium]
MRATLANNRKVVIKASAMQDVRIEAKISMMAAIASVPVPRILAEGEDALLPGSHWFAMEHLAGVPWYQAGWILSQSLDMLPELAPHFVALHRIQIEGFGPLNLNGTGAFTSWPDWLRSGFERTLKALGPFALFPRGFPTELLVALEKLSPALAGRPGVLLHADLGEMEVYVAPEGGCITGIVDWGSSIGGDPLYEFSRFVAGGPVDDPRPSQYRQPLREAYDRLSPSLPPHDPAIERLYDLHNTLLNAEWAVKEAPDWIAPLCIKAQELLYKIR